MQLTDLKNRIDERRYDHDIFKVYVKVGNLLYPVISAHYYDERTRFIIDTDIIDLSKEEK